MELEVRDTGIGIDPDFLPWVFERFRQAESAVTHSPHRGMGLGLAIVSPPDRTARGHGNGP